MNVPAVATGKAVSLYERMTRAIEKCHSVDEYRGVADQASAVAAYYKQIKDGESVKRFLQIKFRSWRRIGEIIIDRVGVIKGEYISSESIRKVREAFKDDAAVTEFTDSEIHQAIAIAELPADFFEANIGKGYQTAGAWFAAYNTLMFEQEVTPEERERLLKESFHSMRSRETSERRETKIETLKSSLRAAQEEIKSLQPLRKAHAEATAEVGITLNRRDRERMREVVFLIKEPIHEALRQAAFDKRTTMQAILRSRLAMWFAGHGYDVPISEMDLRPKR